MKLTREEARSLLLATVGPRQLPESPDAVLAALREIQIDPLDRIGPNADLVTFARTRTLGRGAIHQAAGFEHFAKEWCLLPPERFPAYRDQARVTPTWRHTRAMKAVDDDVLDAVYAEVDANGPVTAGTLGEHGAIQRRGGAWSGTRKLGTLAMKVLTLRCRLVVVGRERGQRVVDTAERALGDWATRPAERDFFEEGVLERVRSAGLLAQVSGPWWSLHKDARKNGTVDRLLADGRLREVTVEGSSRRYLVDPDALDQEHEDDGRLRILGPLDALLWNRSLVEQVFGFRYVWEVYKPAAKREFGYYVVPLLHRGALVGRLEASVVDGRLRVDRTWDEGGLSMDALSDALGLLAVQLGCAPP